MTIAQARQYNRSYQKRLLKYGAMFSGAFKQAIVADFKRVGANLDASTEIEIDRKPYQKLFYKLYLTIGMQEAQLRHNQTIRQKKSSEELLYDWGTFLRGHVDLFMANQVTRIAETTRNDIKAVIEEGLKNGYGYEKIARQLRATTGDEAIAGRINPTARALLISRTEGNSAANLGAMRAAQASGVLMEKSWLHGYNAKRQNRLAHILLGKEKGIPLDRPFMVNGKLMQYPGDPAGGPGEICNCKCTVLCRPIRDAQGNSIDMVLTQPESIVGAALRLTIIQAMLTLIWENVFGEVFAGE